jgi:trans-aconitate 2-methyltransferase
VEWEPEQYERFSSERSQPFDDLLDLIGPAPEVRSVVDYGCGSGQLTARLSSVFNAATVGVDSSTAMLSAASRFASDRVRFLNGDLAAWLPGRPVDLIVASASLQWVGDHAAVLSRWRDALAPGGRLAVQVPANSDGPAHAVARQLACQEPYRSAFSGGTPPPDPVAVNVLRPDAYSRLLYDLGFVSQHVQLRVYPHVLGGVGDLVEWAKGTTLNRFKPLLAGPLFTAFVQDYHRALLAELGDQSPLFFPFKRILFTATRP